MFVLSFGRYATQQENLLEKLRAAEALVSSFNKREELFNIPVTDYSELDLIRQDFEPYAALWNMAFVFQVRARVRSQVQGNRRYHSVAIV